MLLTALCCTAGCGGNVYFSDDEGAPRPSAPAVGDHPDELSQPYVLGTKIDFTLARAHSGDGPWSVRSDSPTVFAVSGVEVQGDGSIVAHGQAMGEGAATLHALDGAGHEHRSVQVSVSTPDEARLYPHGPLRVSMQSDHVADALALTSAKVLVGGQAVFPVAYFRAGQRLYGRGIAMLDAPATVTAAAMTSTGMPVNEWLFVSASAAGAGDVHLKQNGTLLATLSLTALPESALATLTLQSEPVDGKHDGDKTWVMARANDANGDAVYGVYTSWNLDGQAQARQMGDNAPPAGDLYRFRYASGGAARALSATHGTLTANAMIAAKDGYVQDTTYLGCSAAPGAPGYTPWLLFVLVSVALALRGTARRRRDP
jgi:hypothetical protein